MSVDVAVLALLADAVPRADALPDEVATAEAVVITDALPDADTVPAAVPPPDALPDADPDAETLTVAVETNDGLLDTLPDVDKLELEDAAPLADTLALPDGVGDGIRHVSFLMALFPLSAK